MKDFKSIKEDLKKNWLDYLIDLGNFIWENILNKKQQPSKQTKVEYGESEQTYELDNNEQIEEELSTNDMLITPENWEEYLNPEFYYKPNICTNCFIEAEDKGLKFDVL